MLFKKKNNKKSKLHPAEIKLRMLSRIWPFFFIFVSYYYFFINDVLKQYIVVLIPHEKRTDVLVLIEIC